MKYDDAGVEVLYLQRALLNAGKDLGRRAADGDLGPKTWSALESVAEELDVEIASLEIAIRDLANVPVECLEWAKTIDVPSHGAPILTNKPWPTVRAVGARAWLANRSGGERLHAGVDLGDAQDRVVAPETGVVELVGSASYGGDEPRWSDPPGWGGYGPELVLMRSATDRWHLFAHVDAVSVEEGDEVRRGDRIAEVASRGRHLHWEVRTRATPLRGWATVEIVIDPITWFVSGKPVRWSPELRCPPAPGNTRKTPRACRP